METLQFKTNIKCTGCIATVSPLLNEVVGEDNWEVDLKTADKVLTVSTEKANKLEIKQAVEKAGFWAEVFG